MSDTTERMPYAKALDLAQTFIRNHLYDCERMEIAGSLRRKKETVGDIEICVIPKYAEFPDLFGNPGERYSRLDDGLRSYNLLKNGPKYKQIQLAGCKLDLFICTRETWGVNFAIRTGSADFSQWLVTPRQKGGALPSNMAVKDARVWRRDIEALPTPEEIDVFNLCNLPWIEPEKRTEGRWAR